MKVSNLFSNARIEKEPFPYIVWDKLLDDDIFEELCTTMPEHDAFNYASKIIKNESKLWKEYTEYFTSVEFHKQILDVFDIQISDSVGLRKRDNKEFVTESFIAIREPSADKWCLQPHIDSKWAITSMVHYFKKSNDDDASGDFVILKPNKEITYTQLDKRIKYADPDCFDIVETIPYSSNNAICTLTGPNVWHGILPRKTNIRRTVNISYEKYNG
jgi:hypothetical protein|tara:strand:+ start:1555 stop:2202 length:648 start_codon:yes stop_codon:yes gene_type:complete